MISRRRFLHHTAAFGGAALAPAFLAPWARSAVRGRSPEALSGTEFHLSVARAEATVDGRAGGAVLINGSLPAPLLRWREGDEIALHVTNHLGEDTSIHWHGILLPFQMDGVPGISFPGIKPHETFVYRFPVKQAGTYWYHSHSGFQEQAGHYGPIVIDPKGKDPAPYDREHVIVLSDWAFMRPEKIFAQLKKESDSFNFQKRTLLDFAREAADDGFGAAFADRAMWGGMRMSPADISDVTGSVYTYLVNGHGPGDNWTGLFEPGERVRLRIINASAMTIFNVRVPGLPMTVVASDGLDVRPVETDEFQIGVAETYDAIVVPGERAYALMAEAVDRSGYGRATLAPRAGMSADIPPLRQRPTLTMKDMAMDHGGMTHGGMDHGSMDHGSMDHGAMNHAAMGHGSADQGAPNQGAVDHAAMGHGSGGGEMQAHDHKTGAGVDMVAMAPSNRLADRGMGLEHEPHRVLVYAELESLAPNPDLRAPEREIELHLTGNMSRFMWSFDGEKFSEVNEPIRFAEGERVRLTLVNDTMMQHPIHLHGMFFDVVTGDHANKPRKHTINVKPGEKLSVDITADAVGDWAFHCHLLYHMMAGMMRTVSVVPAGGHESGGGHEHHGAPPKEEKKEAPSHDHHSGHGGAR